MESRPTDSSATVMVFGHNGQDGTLLRESLASDRICVVGVSRDSVETFDSAGIRISSVPRPLSVRTILEEHRPQEIYYLAAEHFSSEGPVLPKSGKNWERYLSENTAPYESLLEGVLAMRLEARVFYAASSKVFGGNDSPELDERSFYAPRDNYAEAKVRGIELGAHYRGLGVWVASGILFNHESHLRPRSFFSSKVILSALEISSGEAEFLEVGSLKVLTDWGYARDFVKAFRLILSVQSPQDFLVATGENNSAGDFVRLTFENLGLDWTEYVVHNPRILSSKTSLGLAQITQLQEHTGWAPSLSFVELITTLTTDHRNAILRGAPS